MSDLVARARAFAREVHASQRRRDAAASPYFIHLEKVAALVTRFGGSEAAICAAWLHDTVEDQPVSPEQLAAEFGPQIASIVAELTDDKELPKAERKRLQEVNAPGKSPEAALVKLADKSSNIRAVGATPPVGWPDARRLDYVAWGERVVNALPPLPREARDHFDAVVAEARRLIASG